MVWSGILEGCGLEWGLKEKKTKQQQTYCRPQMTRSPFGPISDEYVSVYSIGLNVSQSPEAISSLVLIGEKINGSRIAGYGHHILC